MTLLTYATYSSIRIFGWTMASFIEGHHATCPATLIGDPGIAKCRLLKCTKLPIIDRYY